MSHRAISNTVLTSALQEGSISQVASALLRFTALGGNINGRMHEEHLSPGVEELDTFLHVAFRHRRIDMIKHLIGKGANPNVQNWHLETPAMTAERQNLAYLLPATGADREKSTVWTTDQEIFNKPKMVLAPCCCCCCCPVHLAWTVAF